MATRKDYSLKDDGDPRGFPVLVRAFLDHKSVAHHSPSSVLHSQKVLAYFVAWCVERGVERPVDVTRQLCEHYQRYLFHYRKADGKPLSITSQKGRLTALRMFFKWATKKDHVLYNPASELEMRRVPHRLPRAVLSAGEVERIMVLADLTQHSGLRDRAMLETLYSTGVRRTELASLVIDDIDQGRGTLLVRQGKGRKDRMVPIGERAVAFIAKYLDEAREALAVDDDVRALFLNDRGTAFDPDQLTWLVRRYVERSGIGKPGACHLFRHTMATLMLDGGADIRFIQAMLGHADLSTTEIYTRVSIVKLKEIHRATHPSARIERRREELNEAGDAAAELPGEIEGEDDEDAAGEHG